MDYTLYETEDFLTDDSFLDYCSGRNQKHVLFWRQWIASNPQRRQSFNEAVKLYHTLNGGWSKTQLERNFEAFESRLHQHIARNVPNQSIKSRKLKLTGRMWYGIASAAAAILIIYSIIFYFNPLKPSGQNPPQSVYLNDVLPGGNKATLTLANGTKINLSDAKNGQLSKLSGIVINKTADGKVVYTVSGNIDKNTPVEYNTIETPKGGQYTINLPDGSSVTLNAASSLKFPSSFSGLVNRQERNVELSGEGYFQIAKDSRHPFVVKTATQQVRVLGTHFNINAYTDEVEVKTTLEEGSIRVKPLANSSLEIDLKPGQQSKLKGDIINVMETNTDLATDWVKGDFIFKDEPIKSAMRRLSRWYDVEVLYEGQIPQETFTGKISRSNNISQILSAMESTKAIHFKVEGRRVTLMGR